MRAAVDAVAASESALSQASASLSPAVQSPAPLSPIMQHSDTNILRSQLDFRPVSSNGSKPKSRQRGARNGVLGVELVSFAAAVGQDEADVVPFHYAHVGLTSERHAELLAQHGPNALHDTKISRWYTFCQQLWQPMPIMIWVAIIIEASILNFLDAGILFCIQMTNASIGFYELTKAGDTVAKLQESLQAKCTVCRDGRFVEMPAKTLVPGDLIILAAGSCVPADCRVNPEGRAGQNLIDVDESAMNGESLPKGKREGDEALMGTMVVRGECHGTVAKTGAHTELGTTAALLRQDDESSNLQKLLVSIVTVLVGVSVALCAIVLVYLTTAGREDFTSALSFTVVVLVASIPMAVEIVTNTTLALGSAELNKESAIVSRLSAIEDVASMSILCLDKTGTLTTNHMEIQDDFVAYREGETRHSLLRYCAMAAKWRDPPRDALDTMLLEAVDMLSMSTCSQSAHMPFDPVQKRTEGTVADSTRPELGTFRTSKGAPKPILALCDNVSAEFKSQFVQDNETWGRAGIRSIAVARTNAAGAWEMMGMLSFMDPPRADAKETIENARQLGIEIKMISGDNYLICREISRLLDLGTICRAEEGLPVLDAQKIKPHDLAKNYGDMCLATNTFSQVFPEHKFLIVECLRELGHKVGMTGDGVNDAPALKRADVGVAVSGATEAAQSAADLVLTRPGLSTIITAIVQSRQIFARIRNFLTYRIAATLQLLCFFFVAVFWFKPAEYQPIGTDWPPFFRIPFLMLMLITLLNDGTLIAEGYDNVVAQEMPAKWNRPALFFISCVLATVALASSLLLLWFLLDSWQADSTLAVLGLGNLSYGQITTAIFLKISISDFLTLFSARTGGDWFFSTKPAAVLVGAGCIALLVSTMLAVFWPSSRPDDIETLGLGLAAPKTMALWIWVYCILWFFVQDATKVFCHGLMTRFNWFGCNDTGKLVLPESALQWKRDHENDVHAYA